MNVVNVEKFDISGSQRQQAFVYADQCRGREVSTSATLITCLITTTRFLISVCVRPMFVVEYRLEKNVVGSLVSLHM